MKYLKMYEHRSNRPGKYDKPYQFNQDGTVDVYGDVDLSDCDYKLIPYRYRKVTGDFNLNRNELTSLKGCPVECRDFKCISNKLTSLKFSPRIINGHFDCSRNEISSMVGGPDIVRMTYDLFDNNIVDLNGFPKEFDFSNRIDLGGSNPISDVIDISVIDFKYWNRLDEEYIERTSKFIKNLIEFNVIDGNKIDELRLQEAYRLTTNRKWLPHKVLKNYQLI